MSEKRKYQVTNRKSAKATVNLATHPRFSTNPKSNLFQSVLSKGPRNNRNKSESFAYDLSPGELYFANITKAMKAVPDAELSLLNNGQRTAYLERRYEHIPELKYNFPEATSWRIGWMHNHKLNTIHH